MRRNRGIHPRAHAGVYLLIWVVSTILDGVLTSFMASDAAIPSGSEPDSYALYLSLEEALAAVLWLLV